MICMDCLDSVQRLIPDKGQKVCQSCYGKRYGGHRKKKLLPDRTMTIKDLQRKWNRND